MKIKKTLYIQSVKLVGSLYYDRNDTPEIHITEDEKESSDYAIRVTLGKTEVEIEVDDSNLHARMTDMHIETLENEKTRLLAENNVKINNITAQIAELKSLECK